MNRMREMQRRWKEQLWQICPGDPGTRHEFVRGHLPSPTRRIIALFLSIVCLRSCGRSQFAKPKIQPRQLRLLCTGPARSLQTNIIGLENPIGSVVRHWELVRRGIALRAGRSSSHLSIASTVLPAWETASAASRGETSQAVFMAIIEFGHCVG